MARRPLRVLSLCAGIGGLDLGVRMACPDARTVCYVEHEAFAAEVLASRMDDEALDAAPLWTDLRTFDGGAWRGAVDLVVAGYPCQPFSVAGKRRGQDDPRHLWPHVARILDETQAPLAFFENVAGHVRLGLSDVLGDLADLGFDAEWCCVRASDVGAPHRRERLFVLAHRGRELLDVLERGARAEPAGSGGGVADAGGARWQEARVGRDEYAGRESETGRREVGDADGAGESLCRRLEGVGRERESIPAWPPGPNDADGWSAVLARWPELAPAQPAVRGVAHGAAHRVDRLRALGNAVVPQQAALAFAILAQRLS